MHKTITALFIILIADLMFIGYCTKGMNADCQAQAKELARKDFEIDSLEHQIMNYQRDISEMGNK